METEAVGRVLTEARIELLDFVVDPVRHRLIGDPRHGGAHIIEMC